jgi:protein O-GlcNAc transferase
LAGHTGQSRLAVFAWRPAPVQVSWLGYWATTGVAEIDFLLVDETSVHADEAKFHSERLWFLPDTRLCFSPPDVPFPIEPGPLPALTNGYVTFGSFQALSKVSDATLVAWSEILALQPNARLRLQSKPFWHGESVTHMNDRLRSAHIDISRVDLIASTAWEFYLAAYTDIDVILDTFPFPGGTTTAEALWMGVPTVTLMGQTLVGRQGASMLRCAGLDDWIAANEQEYVRIALEKVTDLAALVDLRATLRASVLASPLFDGARFAKNLESALWRMVATKAGGLTAPPSQT